MRLSKTITAATFFLALFISQAGYYFIYSVRQNYLKEIAEKKIIAGIPDEMLITIDVSDDGRDIQWREGGRELYLHGQLYDVAKTKTLGGKTIILCFNDKNEGQLLRQFSNATRSANDQNAEGKSSKQTVKFQFSDLMIAVKKTAPIYKSQSPVYFSFNDHIVPGTLEVKSPPPKT